MSKTYHSEAGKGFDRRPREVSKETYESNWDRIFGKKEKNSGCSTESEPSQEEVPVGE